MMEIRASSARSWLFVAAVSVLAAGLWRLGILVHEATPEVFGRADHLAFALTLTAGTLAVIGLFLKLERAPIRSIGLTAPLKGLGQGAAWWLVPAGVGLAFAVLMGWGGFAVTADPADAVLKFAALIALVFLSEALPEELIFRGYLQSRLAGLIGPWGGVLVQAALFTGFAVLIGAAPDLMQAGFIAAFGIALGVLRAATGSLWAPIGFHLAFMTLQQSHGGGWELVNLDLPEMMRMLILVQIPFGLVIALLFSRVNRARAA